MSAATALGATPSGADPSAESVASITARVERLYIQAEQATEKYNAAAERAEGLRGQVGRVQDRVARGQSRVNQLRGVLGSLAGEQYRSGGTDPSLTLLFSSDPDSYLRRAATLDRIGSWRRAQLNQLATALRELDQQRREGAVALTALERQQTALRQHKDAVQARLGTARRLLDRLTAEQRAAHHRGDHRATSVPPGDLPDLGPSSARARAAVVAAVQVIGAPYAWGAAGPSSFDCSGLTSWAYRQAGVVLPRTSQAQSHAGVRVPLSQARPGDLVVYRPDAGHVAMYVGDGRVVHAPHPGARVRYDSVAMMPIHSVTRP